MALPRGTLTLASSATPVYAVHPVVVFSILDHYKRRQPHQHRVIGTLMGERLEHDRVAIKSSFPVPHHQEDDDTIVVDMDYNQSMLMLQKQANPREVVVGWYSTGEQLTYISSLMHTVYRAQVAAPLQPVALMIDVSVTGLKLNVSLYEEHSINVNGAPCLSVFSHVRADLCAYDEERIGVDALIEGTPDDHDRLDAPSTILTESEQLHASMTKLFDAVQVCAAYVSAVEQKKIVGDTEIAHAIHAALNSIPQMDEESFTSVMQTHIQDLLMIMYLAGLTKTQLQVADKVNALLQ